MNPVPVLTIAQDIAKLNAFLVEVPLSSKAKVI